MNKQLAMKKNDCLTIEASYAICFAATSMLAMSAFAVDIAIPTPAEFASWPAPVLLAFIALVSLFIAYKTWCKVFVLQENTVDALHELRDEIIKASSSASASATAASSAAASAAILVASAAKEHQLERELDSKR